MTLAELEPRAQEIIQQAMGRARETLAEARRAIGDLRSEPVAHDDLAQAIITESALSFLGLGFPSDFPTWGRLLFDGVPFLNINPARVVWPGLAISLTVLSVNYMGDGLRDALVPRIRGR